MKPLTNCYHPAQQQQYQTPVGQRPNKIMTQQHVMIKVPGERGPSYYSTIIHCRFIGEYHLHDEYCLTSQVKGGLDLD